MPEVFYDMELDDFFLMQKGFFNKRKDDSLQFAKVGFYIAAIHQNGLAGKSLSGKTFYQEWFGDVEGSSKPKTKEELSERSKKMMERVKYTTKLLDEKEKLKSDKNTKLKNAKRAKNSN